jgi:hypothetical protein
LLSKFAQTTIPQIEYELKSVDLRLTGRKNRTMKTVTPHQKAHDLENATDKLQSLNREGSHVAVRPKIEDPYVITLSAEDQRALAHSILNPPMPTPSLCRAALVRETLIKTSR